MGDPDNTPPIQPFQPAPDADDDPPAPRRRGGGFGAFVARLFFAIFTVLLTLAAAGGIAYLFGYRITTAQQVQQQSTAIAALQREQAVLQTAVTNSNVTSSSDREILQILDDDVQQLQQDIAVVNQLSTEMRENIALASTAQAEARDTQAQVAAFATVQAERNAQLDELTTRTDRIARFLARLGDIADDATLDLQGDDPPPTTPPTATRTPPALRDDADDGDTGDDADDDADDGDTGDDADGDDGSAATPTRTPTDSPATPTRTPTDSPTPPADDDI